MGALVDHIKAEWRVMKGAPISFVALLLLGLSGGFAVGMAWRGQEVANAESLARVRDAQREFSEQQLIEIKERLKSSPSSVDILDGKPGSTDQRVDQLKRAFSTSGWEVNTGPLSGVAHSITLRAKDDNSATTIENALKGAGVGFETVPSTATGTTDFVLGAAGQ
jgi:hypothetical protein